MVQNELVIILSFPVSVFGIRSRIRNFMDSPSVGTGPNFSVSFYCNGQLIYSGSFVFYLDDVMFVENCA